MSLSKPCILTPHLLLSHTNLKINVLNNCATYIPLIQIKNNHPYHSSTKKSKGYVLRCGQLDFEPLPQLPSPSSSTTSLWLVLDEVVDPQNFGALLRSAYFLGNGGDGDDIGVLVCAKNSAPPSATVSAASAGALELSEIYSTSNLPRTLNSAKEDGWRILGAAASAPMSMGNENGVAVESFDLGELNVVDGDGKKIPTVLVLGSEGRGLRTLVAKACTGFVSIPGGIGDGGDSVVGVDSLNVSVTGGIMLWHLKGGSGR